MDLTDHPFLNVLSTFFVIFIWVAWFSVLISIVVDVFRRHDISGGAKGLWLGVLIFLPVVGVLAYVVTQSAGMSDRQRQVMESRVGGGARQQTDGGGPASEIQRAKELLDAGAIDESEFARLKEKALA